jgi:diguanylate cyclase (GGDEF)-like protein
LERQLMKGLAGWWRQPDGYVWLTGYLQAHGLSATSRRIFAGVAATLMLAPANVLWGPTPLYPRLALVLAVLAGLTGLGLAALWLSRWPTRGQSIFFAATWSVTVAVGCLLQANPLVALMACSTLAVSGGYIAFFHTVRYLAVNFWLAGTVGAIEAVRLAAAGEVMLAVSGYVLVLELNVIVSFTVHIVVRAVGVDLLRANLDPLTGLLNRRACERAIVGRILGGADDMFLAVAMVDLDRFKDLNDRHGHAAGDAALVSVARALSAVCKDTALVGRIGGEEFLIADLVTTDRPREWGQQFCDAVAMITSPVTASVGTAALALRSIGRDAAAEAFRQVVAHADGAMYEAKRCGGNQARHHFP